MLKNQFPNGKIKQFLYGFSYPARGLSFINKHKLWSPCIWPIIIDFILCATLVFITVFFADNLRDALWAKPVGQGFWIGLQLVLWHALHVIFILVIIALNILLFALLGTAIAAPFLDVLSQRTEKILGVLEVNEPKFFVSLIYSIKDALFIILFYLSIIIPLLLVNLVPFLGGIIYAVLSAAFAWLMLTLEFVSLPLNRRIIPFNTKWQLVWTNKWTAMGFGCAVFLMMLVPLMNILLIPLAAVGGTIYFTELVTTEQIPQKMHVAFLSK